MFISDGFVFGGRPEGNIKIKSVKPLPDRMMILNFSTGESRLFDATVLTGPAFSPLEDDSVFMNPSIDYGVVTWLDGEVDCAPEYMYAHSYEYVTKDFSSMLNA